MQAYLDNSATTKCAPEGPEGSEHEKGDVGSSQISFYPAG